MMICQCKNCGKKYPYDGSRGYATDLCGPFCDGQESMKAELSALRRDSEMLDYVLKNCSIIPDGTRPNLQSREEVAEAMIAAAKAAEGK